MASEKPTSRPEAKIILNRLTGYPVLSFIPKLPPYLLNLNQLTYPKRDSDAKIQVLIESG